MYRDHTNLENSCWLPLNFHHLCHSELRFAVTSMCDTTLQTKLGCKSTKAAALMVSTIPVRQSYHLKKIFDGGWGVLWQGCLLFSCLRFCGLCWRKGPGSKSLVWPCTGSSYALTISDVSLWYHPPMPMERWAQMSDLPLPGALCFLKSISSLGQKSP